MTIGYSIYEIINDEKHCVLSSPTKEEAEWAFDELRRKIPKYANAEVEWQATFFSDEPMVGYIVK